jgi:hypothetical protein
MNPSPSVGSWYYKRYAVNKRSFTVLHILRKQMRDIGDPFGPKRPKQLVNYVREYMVINNDEGLHVSIETERYHDYDFTSQSSYYIPAKSKHLIRLVRLIFSGKEMVDLEIH